MAEVRTLVHDQTLVHACEWTCRVMITHELKEQDEALCNILQNGNKREEAVSHLEQRLSNVRKIIYQKHLNDDNDPKPSSGNAGGSHG